MVRAWEEYLFTEHNALAVSPWMGTRALQLLDILVKQDHGYHFPGSAPVITKIGTFFSLHKRAQNADADALVDKIKARVHEPVTTSAAPADDFNKGVSAEEPVIKRERRCNLKQTVKASSKTLASVQEFVKLEHNSSKELSVTVEGVTLESVNRDCIMDAIARKTFGPVWTPDMDRIAIMGGTPCRLTGYVNMWIVTDIFYAEKFTVDANTSSSAKLGASVPGALIGAPVPEVGADVSNEGSAATVRELTGGNVPFAVRAMRLRYKSDGKLVRLDTAGRYSSMEAVGRAPMPPITDPASHPRENIGDLFSDPPDVADPDVANPEADEFVPLDIIVDGDAPQAPQQSHGV